MTMPGDSPPPAGSDTPSPSDPSPAEVTANIEMKILSKRISLQLTVSTGPIGARELLPIAHGLTQVASDIACSESEASGKPVSCKAGCGACCRQLIPITQPEAHQLRALVGAMPDARRLEVERRFDDALSQLQHAGMLDALRSAELWSGVNPVEFGDTYFRLGIACPFLEDESCSIHEARPMTCRAFSVTSPAENCRNPRPDNIEPVKHPLPRPLDAFGRAIAGAADGTPAPWVPLALALDYARNVPEPPPEHPGPHLLRAVFAAMTGTDLPNNSTA
jgi:Fe-S-cluster containining protein